MKTFGMKLKNCLSLLQQKQDRGELSISQRQAIIKLRQKKDRGKIYIKNWRPISLLNVDIRITSKPLSERLKNVLFGLISTQQTAYIKNRYFPFQQGAH